MAASIFPFHAVATAPSRSILHIHTFECRRLHSTQLCQIMCACSFDALDTPLEKKFGAFSATCVGVGMIVGAGLFVSTGGAAKDIAG